MDFADFLRNHHVSVLRMEAALGDLEARLKSQERQDFATHQSMLETLRSELLILSLQHQALLDILCEQGVTTPEAVQARMSKLFEAKLKPSTELLPSAHTPGDSIQWPASAEEAEQAERAERREHRLPGSIAGVQGALAERAARKHDEPPEAR